LVHRLYGESLILPIISYFTSFSHNNQYWGNAQLQFLSFVNEQYTYSVQLDSQTMKIPRIQTVAQMSHPLPGHVPSVTVTCGQLKKYGWHFQQVLITFWKINILAINTKIAVKLPLHNSQNFQCAA